MIDSLPSISITMMSYGWSKWGGGTEGLAKESLDEWYCQICGEKQIRVLPSYMLPLDITQRDFIRVCASCKAKAKQHKVSLCWEILRIVKGV